VEGNKGKYAGREHRAVQWKGIKGSMLERNYTGGGSITAQRDVGGIFMGGYFMILSETTLCTVNW
jgi:hypothetical protein